MIRPAAFENRWGNDDVAAIATGIDVIGEPAAGVAPVPILGLPEQILPAGIRGQRQRRTGELQKAIRIVIQPDRVLIDIDDDESASRDSDVGVRPLLPPLVNLIGISGCFEIATLRQRGLRTGSAREDRVAEFRIPVSCFME